MALCLRITYEAAGVDNRPFCPTRTRPKPFAAAILIAVWTTDSLKKRPSPPMTSVEPSLFSTVSKIDWMKFSTYRGCWKTVTFLRRPDVPGRWSENGVVGMRVVTIGADHFLEAALSGPVLEILRRSRRGSGTILGSLGADATAK